MKHPQQIVTVGAKTTFADVWKWGQELERLYARIAPRFVGQSGRFSARRGYNRRPNRCWYAQRTIHQQFHSKYIGVSECITVTLLEQVAAYLQSYALMS